VKSAGNKGALDALRACLDAQAGRYRELRGAKSFGNYLEIAGVRADEETLTEPVLQSIMERVLGFPPDAYVPQYGKGGLKPDITPFDLIAHSFVLDAKSSDERLDHHEDQIRRYMSQRSLDFGVLFNLRELRVYRRRDASGHDPERSFSLLHLWHIARGEALSTGDLGAFERFLADFSYREMGIVEQIEHVRHQPPWPSRLAGGEPVEVDTEYLVEKLRLLSRELVDDAEAQFESLLEYLSLNPARERKLIEELEMLALDISPGAHIDELPQTIAEWKNGEGLLQRVWRQYLLRVVYLVLTRILLYRAWEDVEFVDSYLYDGGFGTEYERLSEDVRRVLNEAFLHGAERYPWLYGRENNYSWYKPRPPALARVLYLLAPVPLGRLDADALGGLYESYVDEIDRDRLGQFFTPRSVVRFMLDRAGFSGADGVFRLEGDRRVPIRIFDFATGSGGFLVEAARRIIDEGGIADADARGLKEALQAIVGGIVGGEISPFPYYLTEINLLLQVSRLLGKLALLGETTPTFTLGVLHVDSLGSKAAFNTSLEDLDPALRADQAELVQSERFDLVPLDGEKLDIYRALRAEDNRFDLVVGNPPYVTEANNKPLFERLRDIAAWKGIYRGKTDYSYYFLLLALEKLAPGGRLCVITPAGWMNAGAADFLRERLAGELRLDELFLFGSHRLFAPEHIEGRARRRVPTPTVESAILVATKMPAPKGHKLRVVALEDEAEAARALSGDLEAKTPDRDALLAEMAKRAKGRAGRKGGIHVHDLPQNELRADRPWRIKHSAKDVGARVVSHLDVLETRSSPIVESLDKGWHVFQGIQTGADAYTARIQKRLTADARHRLEAEGAETGDPILELPKGWETKEPWCDCSELLARSIEPRAILYGAVDADDYTSLVWLGHGDQPPEAVLAELERWRSVLATRADLVANPSKPWWENHRAREKKLLRAPKVIALYRTDRGRFALDETGEWQPSIKTTLAVGREDDAPVAYLCGLLNSELLDLWYLVRGKTPRDVWRNYEPKRMNEIPYRRPDGDLRAEQVAALVREIADNRRALLPHRAVVRDLGRIVKDPWKDGPVKIDRAALLAELSDSELISLRLDPELELAHGEFPFGRPHRLDRQTLVFEHSRAERARVAGDEARIDLLSELIAGKAPDDLDSILLPRDLAAFYDLAEQRARLVGDLLAAGRRMVEQVERLVCALYELPDALTDEVIAHAVKRAKGLSQ
jgi:hypothetical protein